MKKTETAAVRRQGDVILIPTSATPSARAKRVTDKGRVILAYGEVTGHCHEVVPTVDNPDPVAPCELFEEPDGRRILVLHGPAALRHDEHAADSDLSGRFEVRQQCEWGLDEIRQVAD